MANIDIQRKRSQAWWWVLGLILLALLIWWLAARGGRGELAGGDVGRDVGLGVGAVAGTPGAPVSGVAVDIDPFLAHVRSEGDFTEMGRAHNYTATGIRLLADALDQLARADAAGKGTVTTNLQRLRQSAEALQRDPTSPRHAEMTRQAFTAAADVMSDVQQTRFPALANQVSEVREAATAVSPDRPLLEQREAVRTFFDRAANTLSVMAGRAG